MTHRPWPIVVIGLFHILAPIVNFWMSSYLLGIGVVDYYDVQARNGALNLWIWLVLPVLAGVSLLTFRMWSYCTFIGFMILVSIYTLRQRLLYPHKVHILLFLLLELINFSIILYFLSPAVKRIYLDKRIRWWQQKPRFLINWKVRINKDSTPSFDGEFLNISEGGAFVRTNTPLAAKDRIKLEFSYKDKKYAISALVVHVREEGYGTLFSDSLAVRKQIAGLAKELRRDNTPARGQEMKLKDSFIDWFRDLMRSGQGIFPK